MNQLSKLNPKAGGGLGGLPTRKEASIVNNNLTVLDNKTSYDITSLFTNYPAVKNTLDETVAFNMLTSVNSCNRMGSRLARLSSTGIIGDFTTVDGVVELDNYTYIDSTDVNISTFQFNLLSKNTSIRASEEAKIFVVGGSIIGAKDIHAVNIETGVAYAIPHGKATNFAGDVFRYNGKNYIYLQDETGTDSFTQMIYEITDDFSVINKYEINTYQTSGIWTAENEICFNGRFLWGMLGSFSAGTGETSNYYGVFDFETMTYYRERLVFGNGITLQGSVSMIPHATDNSLMYAVVFGSSTYGYTMNVEIYTVDLVNRTYSTRKTYDAINLNGDNTERYAIATKDYYGYLVTDDNYPYRNYMLLLNRTDDSFKGLYKLAYHVNPAVSSGLNIKADYMNNKISVATANYYSRVFDIDNTDDVRILLGEAVTSNTSTINSAMELCLIDDVSPLTAGSLSYWIPDTVGDTMTFTDVTSTSSDVSSSTTCINVSSRTDDVVIQDGLIYLNGLPLRMKL